MPSASEVVSLLDSLSGKALAFIQADQANAANRARIATDERIALAQIQASGSRAVVNPFGGGASLASSGVVSSLLPLGLGLAALAFVFKIVKGR